MSCFYETTQAPSVDEFAAEEVESELWRLHAELHREVKRKLQGKSAIAEILFNRSLEVPG